MWLVVIVGSVVIVLVGDRMVVRVVRIIRQGSSDGEISEHHCNCSNCNTHPQLSDAAT